MAFTGRRGGAGPRADKPKEYEPECMLQEFEGGCRTFVLCWAFSCQKSLAEEGRDRERHPFAMSAKHISRSVAQWRRKAQGQCSTGLWTNEEASMNTVAVTLAVRMRLKQRALPNGAPWRRLGEYAGGGMCAACEERITSAQASYAVDFVPGATAVTVRFHRVCFEIWEHECQVVPVPQV